MTTIQQSPVVNYNAKPQKSNTGKQIGFVAGAAFTAKELSKGDIFQGISHNLKGAVDSYNQNKKTLNRLFTKKEYVKDFIKTAKANHIAQTAIEAGVVMAGAVVAGSLIDKAIDKS